MKLALFWEPIGVLSKSLRNCAAGGHNHPVFCHAVDMCTLVYTATVAR